MPSNRYILASDKVIPGWLQPVAILELCTARGIDTNALLQNTALFASELPWTGHFISLNQYRQLLDNANRLWPGADFPFQFGHQLQDYGLGPLVALVDSQSSIRGALAMLSKYAVLLAPAITMRLVVPTANEALLMVRSAAFASVGGIDLVAAMTALSKLFKRFPDIEKFRFFFRALEGDDRENFTALLAGECCFNAPFDGVHLTLAVNDVATIDTSLRGRVAMADCELLLPSAPFLAESILQQFEIKGGSASDLGSCAQQIGMSQATLKRRLREHGLSFQQLLDLYQLELALIELLLKRASVDEVATRLNFHDSSNFRRAFKRWTGLSPSLMKANFSRLLLPLSK
tara:strand:- start:390 stop:1427 length:1038 start_codon:yes stop_codon:yes gene_type:complete